MNWTTILDYAQDKPKQLETTTSKRVNYLRKNVRRVTIKDIADETESECWQYEQMIIPKTDWETIASAMVVCGDLEEITEANAEGVDTLGEVTDETVTGLGDLAEYVAELETRIEMLEEA